MKTFKITALLTALAADGIWPWAVLGFLWTVNRVYVPEGHSLMLRYKGPLDLRRRRPTPKQGQFAQEGEIGILANLRGPGRHFYCPIWWERIRRFPDVVVQPGHVAVVTSKMGTSLPSGASSSSTVISAPPRTKASCERLTAPADTASIPMPTNSRSLSTETEQVGDPDQALGLGRLFLRATPALKPTSPTIPAQGKIAGIQKHVPPHLACIQ